MKKMSLFNETDLFNKQISVFPRSVCGYVSKAVMCTGEGSDTGVDAAVVTITNGMPISAECPRLTIEQLASAGMINSRI